VSTKDKKRDTGSDKEPNKVFYFKQDVVPIIISEIEKANEFIKMAIFQIHDERIFKALEKRLPQIKIEIITLPYDSIHDKVHDKVVQRYTRIENQGAKIHFIRWNIGDTERTTAAVGHWYSYHGKFIVTDKAAISLSANFTETSELDAILLFREQEKINEFSKRFDYLRIKFIEEKQGFFGTIREEILHYNYDRIINGEVFRLPKDITTKTHEKTWIRDYPPDMCPERFPQEDRLYIAPFDGTGRYIFNEIISNSNKFLFISTETFTDNEILNVLQNAKLKGVDIKILTGYESMDFPQRVQENLFALLSFGIEIRHLINENSDSNANLHAKLLISENYLIISSINLNQISLGFKPNNSGGFWRENTETFYLCSDQEIINEAKSQFLEIFNNSKISRNVFEGLAIKNKSKIGKLITGTYKFKSSNDAKLCLSKIKLEIALKGNHEFQKILFDAINNSKLRKRKTLNIDDIKQSIKGKKQSTL